MRTLRRLICRLFGHVEASNGHAIYCAWCERQIGSWGGWPARLYWRASDWDGGHWKWKQDMSTVPTGEAREA